MMEKNRDALKLQYYLSHPDDMLFELRIEINLAWISLADRGFMLLARI